jgi:chemotaxis protein methyltransferase CheR
MVEAQARREERLWDDTSRWVEETLGLHYTPPQWPDLQRGLTAAAVRLGLPSATACAQRALNGALEDAQREVLAECLTIGETYFFRHPEVFEQLATDVLQPLIAARRTGTRHLRMWSAGCASGEEAYSLAMVVASLLPEWRNWNVSILGTDINNAVLRKARAGVYGAWSVRGSMPPRASSWLHRDSEGRYHVDAELRRMVRFGRFNLVRDDDPPERGVAPAGMDVILCRNVLIYFEPGRVRKVLQRLGQALVDGGWLVTTSVEMPRLAVPGLVPARGGIFSAMRRSTHVKASSAPLAPAPRPPARTTTRAAPLSPQPALPLTPLDAPGPSGRTASDFLDQARTLADAGELEDAERLCRVAVDGNKLDADATYLLASILLERGATEEASAALQRTLFLDPGHVLARFASGSLALRSGDRRAGQRHFARALARLASAPPEDVVQGSGGLTVQQLEQAIRRTGGTDR